MKYFPPQQAQGNKDLRSYLSHTKTSLSELSSLTTTGLYPRSLSHTYLVREHDIFDGLRRTTSLPYILVVEDTIF